MEYKALWVRPALHKKIKTQAEKDGRTINEYLDRMLA